MAGVDLSLAELQAFDPGPRRGAEQRFCCPLPACAGKAKTKTHRSLSVQMATGAWHCHRCGAGGILREFHTDARPAWKPAKTRAASARAAFRLASPPPPPVVETSGVEWRTHLQGLQPFDPSPAADYLRGRGITPLFPLASGVRYHPDWYGRGPAVVFPIRDRAETLVAAQGRFLAPRSGQPKAMSAGPVKLGVFATPEALNQPEIIITEAPIDALSLAVCGRPALALIGTHFPDWLPTACLGKRVLIATDADEAGDRAATTLAEALAHLGLRADRLIPTGAKDWNEFLQHHPIPTITRAIVQGID